MSAFAFLLSGDRGFSHHLHVSEADGRGLRRVTGQRALGRPSFSPDGLRIAFPGPLTDDSDGRYGLYHVGVDGSGLRRVTAPSFADHDPAWSPDGSMLAFARDVAGGMTPSTMRLMVMPAGGGSQSQRASVPGARHPAWSPDGELLAFTASGALYVIGADGTGLRQVAGGGARFPAWSPDGRTIAFVQQLRADRSRLVVVPAAGGTVTLRADPGGQIEDPGWAADGQTLHCVFYRGFGYDDRRDAVIWRVPPGSAGGPVARFGVPVQRLAHFPDPPPGVVTALLSQVTQRTVRLTWTNPSDPDLLAVDVRMVEGATPATVPTAGTLVYTGRTPEALVRNGIEANTTYSFSVFARDRGGTWSPAVTTTVTTPPARVPDPPIHVEAVPGASSARVSWTPPLNDGGHVVTRYTVAGIDVPAAALSAVLTGLPRQPRTFDVVAHNDLGPSVPAVSNSVTPDSGATAGTFTALSPRRLIDTRQGTNPVSSARDRVTPVTNAASVPANAAAVVLTATVVAPTAGGYLVAYPAGGPRPGISTLNHLARQTIANLAVVPVGSGGQIAFGLMAGTAHVVADVVGFYAGTAGPAGGRLNALSPARILDTRSTGGPIGPGQTRVVQVEGMGGVPEPGVASVVLNLTVVAPTATTFLTVHPAGGDLPRASVINVERGDTLAVLVVARLSDDGRIAIYNGAGSAHVVADVVGYHTSSSGQPGELYTPLTPARILDTRGGLGVRRGKVGTEEVVTLAVRGSGGVPASARTVLLNVTATEPSATTFLTVWPSDRLRPLASTLNVRAGRTVANLVLAKLSPTGEISIRNAAGAVHVLGDVMGYFS